MTDNLYAPPAAPVADTDQPGMRADFYIVSISKLSTLYLATGGMYAIFWFYRNWKNYRDATDDNIWPMARALFNYFFVHSLFRRVHDHAESRGVTLDWRPGLHATLLVVMLLISGALDRAAVKGVGSPLTDILSWLALLPLLALFAHAQRQINMACGDAEGRSNGELSGANYLWIAIGAVIWIFALIGAFAGA
ncbi:hypothetical protein ACFONG_20430 [Uliginosibacterium paludis]|uniref:DUF4234 domain-containing protein n=1 Tax=Uliginosibacterium paludis TaxID=1615952 RepID=A0ABV2CVZ8_9RHOO